MATLDMLTPIHLYTYTTIYAYDYTLIHSYTHTLICFYASMFTSSNFISVSTVKREMPRGFRCLRLFLSFLSPQNRPPCREPQKRRAIWNQTLSQIFYIFRIWVSYHLWHTNRKAPPMSHLFTQISRIATSDPSLSHDDIAAALGIPVQEVRMALSAPSLEDIPALMTVSKQIAFDSSAPARTRQGAIEWLVDELKGRNDSKHRNLDANSELTTRMLATLECAQNAVPDSLKLRREMKTISPIIDA